MLTSTRWLWIAAVFAVAGCAFEGATGDPSEEPNGEPMMEPGTGGGGSGSGSGSGSGGGSNPLTCDDFKEIEDSRYLIIAQMLNANDARTRCAAIPGAHLVTFETAEEISRVVTGLPLTVRVWTGVDQNPPFLGSVNDGWANQIGTARTQLPQGFPWQTGEPNDGSGFRVEDSAENAADLDIDGRFDDASWTRTNQVLCECASDDD